MSSIFALVRSVKEEVQPTSSTDAAERVPDTTEVGKTPKESVSVGQGQPLQAAEPDQVHWRKSESVGEMKETVSAMIESSVLLLIASV